jgi:hypothetical protein
MDIHVHEFIDMYIHVCTMFKDVYTVLQYLVQGIRIPDERAINTFDITLPWRLMRIAYSALSQQLQTVQNQQLFW